LIAAAGIGASFAALMQLSYFIASRTHDPVHATDYWIKFFLGIVSGLILTEVIPIQDMVGSGSFLASLAFPILAMFGGFCFRQFIAFCRGCWIR